MLRIRRGNRSMIGDLQESGAEHEHDVGRRAPPSPRPAPDRCSPPGGSTVEGAVTRPCEPKKAASEASRASKCRAITASSPASVAYRIGSNDFCSCHTCTMSSRDASVLATNGAGAWCSSGRWRASRHSIPAGSRGAAAAQAGHVQGAVHGDGRAVPRPTPGVLDALADRQRQIAPVTAAPSGAPCGAASPPWP